MRALFVILLNLLIVSIQAQSLRAPVTRLLEFNDSDAGVGVNGCQEEWAPSASLQQCLVDICGEADVNKSVWLTDENFNEKTSASILESYPTLASDIESIANYFKQVNDIVFEELDDRLNDPEGSMKSMGDDSEENMLYAQLTFEPFLRTIIDLEKPANERMEIVTTEHGLGVDFEKALQDFRTKEYKAIIEGPWYLHALSGLLTPEESFTEVSNRLSDLRDKYESEYGADFLPYEVHDTFETIESFLMDRSDDLYPEDAFQLVQAFVNLDFNLKSLRGEETKIREYSCTSGPCLNFASKSLKDFDLKTVMAGLRIENESFDFSEVVRNCQDMLRAKSYGSDQKVENFQKELPRIIKNYDERVLRRFSTKTRALLNLKIKDNLDFIFPETKNKAQGFESELVDRMQMAERGLPPLDHLEYLPNVVLIKWLEMNKDFDGAYDPLLAVKNLCMPGPFITANDNFAPAEIFEQAMGGFNDNNGKDVITVSPFSCEHESHGKNIISHELGHFISYLFDKEEVSEDSKSEFIRLRSCSKKTFEDSTLFSSAPFMFFEHEGDLQTTEEDTADLLTFMAYPATPGETPFTCSLLLPGDDGGYSIEMNSDGVHSPDFIRPLNEAINKGIPLSAACDAALNDLAPEFKRMKCIE